MNKWEHYVLYGGEMPLLDLPTIDMPLNVEVAK